MSSTRLEPFGVLSICSTVTVCVHPLGDETESDSAMETTMCYKRSAEHRSQNGTRGTDT